MEEEKKKKNIYIYICTHTHTHTHTHYIPGTKDKIKARSHAVLTQPLTILLLKSSGITWYNAADNLKYSFCCFFTL